MNALRLGFSLTAVLVFLTTASAEEIRGRILKIDPDKKELRLAGLGPWRGTVLTLRVDAKTNIIVGGQAAKLSELAPNQRVRVAFEKRGGKPVAQTVRSLGLMRLLQRLPAGTPAAPAPGSSAPPPLKEGEGVTGTLQRVALTDREIVVIGPGAKGAETETTIAVPEGTTIMRDGKKIAFDDLQEGETAAVKTESHKGKLTATSIRVGKVPAAAEAEMPPRRAVIPRLRQVLKFADEVLRELEEQNAPLPQRP